jgi:hypothetical protein
MDGRNNAGSMNRRLFFEQAPDLPVCLAVDPHGWRSDVENLYANVPRSLV